MRYKIRCLVLFSRLSKTAELMFWLFQNISGLSGVWNPAGVLLNFLWVLLIKRLSSGSSIQHFFNWQVILTFTLVNRIYRVFKKLGAHFFKKRSFWYYSRIMVGSDKIYDFKFLSGHTTKLNSVCCSFLTTCKNKPLRRWTIMIPFDWRWPSWRMTFQNFYGEHSPMEYTYSTRFYYNNDHKHHC